MAGGYRCVGSKDNEGKKNRGNRAIRLRDCGGEQGEACQTTTQRGRKGEGGGGDKAEVEEGKMK